ncbi:uncharacterized protein E6C27_scaffold236G00520 [Cucumis melo var. makuwa]|uniref:Uncharacterized protein n=2 Tax=Cucumis melo TaxID=3656 RepID=A0A5A7TJT8_CUCMM|nr:uncharacterized protein E6C27_scaffold236G00520 [Cucumis melo var. makuwa]
MSSYTSPSSSSSSSSSLQVLPSPSSSTLRLAIKFKALLQTLIFSLARAISRAKTTAFQSANIALKRNKKKLLYGSFRLHYNWCSVSSNKYSHVTPAVLTFDHGIGCGAGGDQLGGYLQWLEERDVNKKSNNNNNNNNVEDREEGVNEIDKLAEIFIARCHEKFKLEKQESYRRFQDMMARSF